VGLLLRLSQQAARIPDYEGNVMAGGRADAKLVKNTKV
jgi:hypothetical protein